MFLITGLGNPGAKYEQNRHNIGFLAVELLSHKAGASSWSKKFSGFICEAKGEPRCYLLKPQTFMNLSGESVAAAARFYKIPPEKIIVLYDDLDLAPGKLRVRLGGGNGGHNGLKSIDAHLGKDYWRVRIGIGRPEHKDDVTNYVLGDFGKAEWQLQERMLEAIAANFEVMLAGDDAGFMNKVALIMNPPRGPLSLPLPRKGGGDKKESSEFPPPLRGRVREGGNATNTMVNLARQLRANMTEAEQKLWYHLRRHNLSGYKFRRQQPLGPFIADFICFEKKLILEVDGSQHTEAAEKDAERTAYLAKTGHKVLRFWNNEVMENIEGVLETVVTELVRPPLPNPLPQGERE